MDWLLLAALGIMWVAFLLPARGWRPSSSASVEEFERRMELLAQTHTHGGPGRWIVTPRKGSRFVGPAERKRARARERRRKVFVFLLEAIGLTLLIGLVPPLRVAWGASAIFGGLLVLYVWLLVTIKHRSTTTARERAAAIDATPTRRAALFAQRHVAARLGVRARPTFNGLGSLGEGDRVHVIVRRAGEASAAGV